jgi:Holliday junction resolvase-like predicted endonuclease
MLDLGQIKKRIFKGEQIEEIIEEIDWKEFEELVESILKKHDYKSCHNFRFKTQSRHEIDILAIKEKINLVIDCKQWSRGRHKKTGLKYAVDSQKNRVKHLKKFLKNNILIQSKLGLKENIEFIPMIVTWFEEDLINHDDVFVVPVSKFNQFLLNLPYYV